MKKIFSVASTITFLFVSLPLIGQDLPDSIVVTVNTYFNTFTNGDSLYEVKVLPIVHKRHNYRLNGKQVPKTKIIKFINELSNPTNLDNSLKKYGIDTAWIKNNPEELLKRYSSETGYDVDWNEEQKKFIYQQLIKVTCCVSFPLL